MLITKKRVLRGVYAFVSLSLLILVCLLTNACTSTITPPTDVKNPVNVYLLNEARHVGIVLPDFNGGFVEYGFGDWDWYAMMSNNCYHMLDTMFWPTQGCLGRRVILTKNSKPFHPQATLEAIVVEIELAQKLFNELEDSFKANLATIHKNTDYGIDFVHSDQDFWIFHNCQDSIADWMEQLGCEVTWRLVRFGIELP